MLNKYRAWLSNAPIRTKFIPMQILTLVFMLTMGVVSFLSIYTLNDITQNIFTKNVEKTERLNEIIQTMYKCRVLGRDILFLDDTQEKLNLYSDYVIAFDDLDTLMNEFEDFVSEEKSLAFQQIIEQKNVYKESMLLSADIHIQDGEFSEALEALRSVTPIANEFFGSIDSFLAEEKTVLYDAMQESNATVMMVFITVIISNIVAAVFIFVIFGSFAKAMSKSLISLEESVIVIAETNDMKKPIPPHLFTNDEIGLIAKVVDKFRKMLLAHSYNDSLTGGLNAAAYHEDVIEIFEKSSIVDDSDKDFWIVVLDMNNLKLINDKLGHVEGDSALKKAHKILLTCFGMYGKIYRIGGDEFVALLEGCTIEQLEEGIDAMKRRVEEANKNNDIKFSFAWGYERFIGNTKDAFEDHFKSADQKMYINKAEMKRLRMTTIHDIEPQNYGKKVDEGVNS